LSPPVFFFNNSNCYYLLQFNEGERGFPDANGLDGANGMPGAPGMDGVPGEDGLPGKGMYNTVYYLFSY